MVPKKVPEDTLTGKEHALGNKIGICKAALQITEIKTIS